MDIEDNEIRKFIIKEPEYVKSLMLTRVSAGTMKIIIEKGSLNAAEFSEIRGISIQNASSQLKLLFLKRYLKRKEIVSETGGIEYIYKSTVS